MTEPSAPAATVTAEIAADPEWVSAHLYYHDDLDEILAQVVSPVVAEFSDAGVRRPWFFLRYWEGGNHLRLRVLSADAADAAGLRDTIASHAGRFFRRRPSPTRLGQDEYARLARALAIGEQLTSYCGQLRPNNSVEFVPYRREYDRYGNVASVRAVEGHFAESSRIALRLLSRGMSGDDRAKAGYCAVVAAWLSAEPDPGQLRNWTSGLFRFWDQRSAGAGASRDSAAFGEDYLRQRDALLAIARTLVAARAQEPGGGQDAGQVTGAWRGSLIRLRNTLAAQAAAGTSCLPDRGWPGEHPTAMRTRVLPVLDTCAHLFCNRLGVRVAEERYLRYLAGRALAEISEERI